MICMKRRTPDGAKYGYSNNDHFYCLNFDLDLDRKREKMNLNELAKEIAKREAGKKEISIAQIKEVVRHLGDISLEEPGILGKIEAASKKRKLRAKKK